MEGHRVKKYDKETTQKDDNFGNVSEKKNNQISQYQDWMEVNSKSKAKSQHEKNSSTRELFYLNLLLNKIKGSRNYENIRLLMDFCILPLKTPIIASYLNYILSI
ncbi:hypothetical protein Bca4012_004217 [Brassica carinata]